MTKSDKKKEEKSQPENENTTQNKANTGPKCKQESHQKKLNRPVRVQPAMPKPWVVPPCEITSAHAAITSPPLPGLP